MASAPGVDVPLRTPLTAMPCQLHACPAVSCQPWNVSKVKASANMFQDGTGEARPRLDACNKLLMWDAWRQYAQFRALIEPWASATCISSIKALAGANANADFRVAV